MKAIIWPMNESNFDKTHYSPIMTTDKPDATARVIVNLSWPFGKGINNYVPGNFFDDIEFSLKYTSIDLVVDKSRVIGPNTRLFKVNLQGHLGGHGGRV